MPNGPPTGTEPETYQWLHIDDFSPGIYDNTYISTETPTVPAPLGAAKPDNTWACASLPGGGLGPLPGISNTHNFASFPGTTTSLLQAGFTVNPGIDLYTNELVSILEGDDGSNRYYRGYSVVPGNSFATNSILSQNLTTTTGFFGSPYPVFTRMTASGAGNPPPVLVFPTADDLSHTAGHLWVYPTLASPTTFTSQDIVASSVTGQTIAYGSRIIVLAGIDYAHPAAAGGGVNTNENINFTDPPLSSTYGSQQTVLGAEIPWGYGAWGSVSVGELLLVKKVGGALIVYGDILAPTTVVRVAGIESTGDIVGSAASTPIGLVYCSEKRGAWVWNGGNTSTKISQNISDDFFDIASGFGTNNYGFFCYNWQNWILFSGNYLFNAQTGGWWILYPTPTQSASSPSGANLWWYSQAAMGNQLYAAPLTVTVADPRWFMLFDSTVPASKYSWQSATIHVAKDADRTVGVRQVVVRASAPDGDTHGSVSVTVGTQTQASTSTIGSTTTILRMNFGANAQQLQDIGITVVSSNSNSKAAPIIHSIDIGYEITQRKAPEN